MFFCSECGAETSKWSGKCPACGSWNTLKEITSVTGKKRKKKKIDKLVSTPDNIVKKLDQINIQENSRLKTGIDEFDGVLGGGLVPGMVTLIGGEPGIGKSTLLLQIADKLAEKNPILYVSGEESEQQIKLRSKRLNCQAVELYLFCTTELEELINALNELKPQVIIIDSIQSIYTNSLDSAPGTISQLRECTALFTKIAKKTAIPIFLIGHITKEGSVAGPKIIEHMVDTVLYFEGEIKNQYKILRATKNRFGSTNEIGIFEMQATGLQEIKNLSQLFFDQHSNMTGTAIGSLLEGSRAFLVEIQVLVSPASYGTSQRVAVGLDHRKLSLLLAVIEKNLGLDLKNNDVFLKISGGLKVNDAALDLAIIAAIISSFREKPIQPNTLFIGEISLNGEVRPVSQINKRLKEAKKIGFNRIIISQRTKNIRTKVHKIDYINEIDGVLF